MRLCLRLVRGIADFECNQRTLQQQWHVYGPVPQAYKYMLLYVHSKCTLLCVQGAMVCQINNRRRSVTIYKHKGTEMRRDGKSPNLLVFFLVENMTLPFLFQQDKKGHLPVTSWYCPLLWVLSNNPSKTSVSTDIAMSFTLQNISTSKTVTNHSIELEFSISTFNITLYIPQSVPTTMAEVFCGIVPYQMGRLNETASGLLDNITKQFSLTIHMPSPCGRLLNQDVRSNRWSVML